MTTSYYFDPANDFRLCVFAQAGRHPRRPGVVRDLGDLQDRAGVGRDRRHHRRRPGRRRRRPRRPRRRRSSRSTRRGRSARRPCHATTDSDKIRLGQLDGDGRLDVAGVGWGTNTVSVLLNDGNGRLRGARSAYAGRHGGYDDLEVADVSGDGRDDLVVMSGPGPRPERQRRSRSSPGGGFGPAAEYHVGATSLTHGIGVGDVTGDGRNDVVASYGGNKPNCERRGLRADGAGTLAPRSATRATTSPSRSTSPTSTSTAGPTSSRSTAAGTPPASTGRQPTGRWRRRTCTRIPYASHYNPHGLAIGDVNGDGSPDVVLADYNNGLVVLRNTTAPSNVPHAPMLNRGGRRPRQRQPHMDAAGLDGGSPADTGSIAGRRAGARPCSRPSGPRPRYTDATATGGATYYYRVSGFTRSARARRRTSARPDRRHPTRPRPRSRQASRSSSRERTSSRSTGRRRPTTSASPPTASSATARRRDASPRPSTSTPASPPARATRISVRAVDAAGNVSAASNNVNAKTVSPANGSTGTLAGAVYDGTGKPLANAVVSITVAGSVKTAKTNASGTWKLGNLPPGSYSPSVSLAGYRTQTVSITPSRGRPSSPPPCSRRLRRASAGTRIRAAVRDRHQAASSAKSCRGDSRPLFSSRMTGRGAGLEESRACAVDCPD